MAPSGEYWYSAVAPGHWNTF